MKIDGSIRNSEERKKRLPVKIGGRTTVASVASVASVATVATVVRVNVHDWSCIVRLINICIEAAFLVSVLKGKKNAVLVL